MRHWDILRTGLRRSDADAEPTGGLPGAAHQVTLILCLPRGRGTFQQRARHHTKCHCRSTNNHLETPKPRCGVTRPGPLAARCECSGGASWASQPRFILRCSRPRRTSGPGKCHRLGLASRSGLAFGDKNRGTGHRTAEWLQGEGLAGRAAGPQPPLCQKASSPLVSMSPHRKQPSSSALLRTVNRNSHHQGTTGVSPTQRPRVAVHPPHSVRHHWAHSESACGRNTVQKR